MNKENYLLKFFKFVFSAALLIGLIIIIVQFNNIETRIIKVQKRISSGKFLTQTYARQTNVNLKSDLDVTKNRTWLHPEAKNIVQNRPLFTPLPNSNYNSTIKTSTPAEEKGYNVFIDWGGNIREYYMYVGCHFARRDLENPGSWLGEVAERVTLTNDGKDVNVYLKKNVKWHKPLVDFEDPKYAWLKGDHYVTAKDVKFTIEDILMNPQTQMSSLRSYFVDFDYIEVVDDYTVILHWKKWTNRNVDALIEDIATIIPEFIYAYSEDGQRIPKETLGLKFNNHWYNDRLIGCGPYKQKEHKKSQYLLLERNEDYITGVKPVPKYIKYEIIADANLEYLKLKSGDIDITTNLGSSVYRDEIKNAGPDSPFTEGKLKYIVYEKNAYRYIGWNNDNKIFADPLVRRAMTYMIDREFLINSVYAGLGEIRTGPVQPFYPEYDQSIKPYPFDLKKARALLEEAGWTDKDQNGILEKEIDGKPVEFEFTMYSVTRPTVKTFLSRVKEDMLKIGVKMNINLSEWAVYLKKVQDRDFDANLGAWGLDPLTNLYSMWHSSLADKPESHNNIAFRNKEMDTLAENTIKMSYSDPERTKLFKQAHKILHDEQPYTFLLTIEAVTAYRNDIKGLIVKKFNPYVVFFTATK